MTMGSSETSRECAMFRPIFWSEHDTDETIASVKEHNAVWKDRCE